MRRKDPESRCEEWELKKGAIRKYKVLVTSMKCVAVLPGQESKWEPKGSTKESKDNQTSLR